MYLIVVDLAIVTIVAVMVLVMEEMNRKKKTEKRVEIRYESYTGRIQEVPIRIIAAAADSR